MSDNVVHFPLHRRQGSGALEKDGLIYCGCGDAWWILDDCGVNFAPDMRIVGWHGKPVCRSCGRPMGTVSGQ